MVDIKRVFEASEVALTARLMAIRAAFQHAGLKGATVENAIRSFLSDNLPHNIAVGSGIVIDSRLIASRQLDIILYDRAKTPVFFSSEGMQIIPVECVYFAIEVKTSLSKVAFDECVANMDSVKALVRSAYYFDEPEAIRRWKTLYQGHPTRTWDTIFLVIALEASVSPETVLHYLEEHRSTDRALTHQIDAMFVLGTGAFLNYNLIPPNTMSPDLTPSDSSIPGLVSKDALLQFLTLFSRFYNQAEIGANFNFAAYVQLVGPVIFPKTTERSQAVLATAAKANFQFLAAGR